MERGLIVPHRENSVFRARASDWVRPCQAVSEWFPFSPPPLPGDCWPLRNPSMQNRILFNRNCSWWLQVPAEIVSELASCFVNSSFHFSFPCRKLEWLVYCQEPQFYGQLLAVKQLTWTLHSNSLRVWVLTHQKHSPYHVRGFLIGLTLESYFMPWFEEMFSKLH